MKIMVILGTRPEGIKLAVLLRLLKQEPGVRCVIVNTAQHREMLDQLLQMFSVVPDYDLDIMKKGQSLTSLTAEMIKRLGEIIDKELPDLVMVLGDTATTFSGAYSAFLHSVPVAHIEAGLRTYNPLSPFPEEMYRQLVTRLSTIHFAPTELNRMTLLKEHIPDEQIHVVGNPVIDTLLEIASRPYSLPPELQLIFQSGRRVLLVTTHRRENFSQLKNIYHTINQLVKEYEDIEFLFPVHVNPQVRTEISIHLDRHPRIHIIEPTDYVCFVNLMKSAYFIITDSGGIQEEAATLGIPVLVTRDSTERPEGVTAGTLKVTGTEQENIYINAKLLLDDINTHTQMAQASNPYGNGTTSLQVLAWIKKMIEHGRLHENRRIK